MSMLRYPVLLVHGMGFRDDLRIGYWGRIPKALQAAGCRIYFGHQDSNASIEANAEHIAAAIENILAETGAEKVNIIAHSKGGLDSRYAISTLGMGESVASLTTLSTPHHGSKTVDKLLRFPDPLVRLAGFCADCWFRLLGDKQPSSYKVFHQFSTPVAAQFNEQNPDYPGTYYQSYAFVMKNGFSDILMWLPHWIVKTIEGENDGLLTPASAAWGNFQGVYCGAKNRGISHCDEVDLRRRPLCKQRSAQGVADMVDVYMGIVSHLADMGF